MVVLVLWSTKYLTPSLVYLISQPSGRGSSFCKLQKKLQAVLFPLISWYKELSKFFWICIVLIHTYPWVRGSSHCVVFVLWFTKYTLSFESTLLSKGKKEKIHYTTAFQISVSATPWNPQLINLPQPGGKGPSGSFSADNIEAYLKNKRTFNEGNLLLILFSHCVLRLPLVLKTIHSAKKKTHHAIFNLILQKNLYDNKICFLHTCFQHNLPSLSLPTANSSACTKRCSSHKFGGSMCQQISTKFLLKNTFYHNKHFQAQWLLPT